MRKNLSCLLSMATGNSAGETLLFLRKSFTLQLLFINDNSLICTCSHVCCLFFLRHYNKSLMSVPLGIKFCFASNLNVCLEFVLHPRKTLKLSEKANQIFPSGADIKCRMCNTYYPHYSTVDMCRCIHFVLEMVCICSDINWEVYSKCSISFSILL
jgi:hypothetical protein